MTVFTIVIFNKNGVIKDLSAMILKNSFIANDLIENIVYEKNTTTIDFDKSLDVYNKTSIPFEKLDDCTLEFFFEPEIENDDSSEIEILVFNYNIYLSTLSNIDFLFQ